MKGRTEKKNVHFVSSFLQSEIIRTKSFILFFSFMILLLVIKKENNYDCYSSMTNRKKKRERIFLEVIIVLRHNVIANPVPMRYKTTTISSGSMTQKERVHREKVLCFSVINFVNSK
jgi:hypothetical protein